MQIHVVDLSGNKYTYDVTPATEINNLIKEIAKDTGYPIDSINIKQRKNDKDVDHTNKKPDLEKHGIVHDDVLDMFYFIHVVTPEGDKITIPCTPNTTKDDIEKEIDDKVPNAPDEPDLIDGDGNEIVPGGLRDPNGVNHDDTIYMRPPCPSNDALTKCPNLKAKACGSKKNRMLCTKCGKTCFPGTNKLVCSIKSLYSKCKIDQLQIHVVDLDGNKYTYEVDLTESIDEIKQKVSDDTGIPKEFVLLKDVNEKGLNKGKTSLDKNKVKDEDTLFMYYFIHVVDPDGNKHTFTVNPNEDIDKLKDDISSKTGIDAANIDLVDENHKPIVSGSLNSKANGVSHDDTLFMPPTCPSYKALTECPKMKKMACKGKKGKGLCTVCGTKCYPGTNPFVCQIKLMKRNKFYGHCQVTSAPTQAPTPMIIHVVDLNGNKYTYEVTGDTVINDIKDKVAADTGMDVDDVNLKEEDDTILDKPFSDLDYNKIVHDDTLYMFYHIHVVLEDGSKYTFEVNPDDSVESIKEKIKDKTGVDVDIFVDKDADNVSTGDLNSNDNNVAHDDTLYVRPSCPSANALEKCPSYGYNYCVGKLKGKKDGCTWCKSSKKCLPTTQAHFCEVGEGAFAHCKGTEPPTEAPTPMIIHVVDLNGNKYTYEVTGDTIINDIKDKVAADTGMDVDDVNLKEEDDTILDKPFSDLDYNKIVHDDTLYMFYHIHVVLEDGSKYTFEVNPDDSVESIKEKIKDKTGVDVDIFVDKDADNVSTGDLNSNDNNVAHDDTLYVRPSCPSANALEKCPSYGYNYCVGKLKGKKDGCTWCKSSKKCLPTTKAHFCEVGEGAFAHCKTTGAPTEPANYCPAGFVYTGSKWACDDKVAAKAGFGPGTWEKTNRCRGFDDARRNFKNKKGEYICVESDAGALGYKYGDKCSQKVTYEEAAAHCAGMNARLCTAEELENSCAERTGCDYDYVHIWSNTPCNPSIAFGQKHQKGHFVMPGDMRKWKNRNIPDGKKAPGFTEAGAFMKNSRDYVIWPDSGLYDDGYIWEYPKRMHYNDAVKAIFGDDIEKCNPEDDEFGRCCIPDSYQETKFYTRCCADYGETPACEKCPEGKTSLPGYDKTLDDCFCITGSLDMNGGCSGPDVEKPDGIVTAKPTSTPAPTPKETLAACPSLDDYINCPKLSRSACDKATKLTDAQRDLAPEERTGGCHKCFGHKTCIGIPGEHIGRAWICDTLDYSHCGEQ